MTYSEFGDWLTFLMQEEQLDTKRDYYLAQIAAEIRRGQVKHPGKVKVNDFLVKLISKAQAKANRSKQTWAAITKVKLDKN